MFRTYPQNVKIHWVECCILVVISTLNLRSSLWKSRSTPLSWTRELPKSNITARKFLSSKFHSGTDVGEEDTMGMGRPSGMSTIIKSTPPVVSCFPLKAQALSNLYCTLQTSFRMKLIAKLEHFRHEALNSKRREIPSQERPSYPPIPWRRPYAAHNMHQWIEGI
jgi:hypothetical protein